MAAPPPPVPTQVSISPNYTDPTIRPGTQLHYNITVANSPPLSGFSVYIKFDPRVLSASSTSVNDSGNILRTVSSSVLVASECINGARGVDGPCTPTVLDGDGVVNLGEGFLGNYSTPNNTSGLLYRLTLTVNDPSLSRDPQSTQVLLEKVVLSPSNSTGAIPSITHDSYFTNRYCTTNILCMPPFVNMTYTPPKPSIGTNMTFSAAGSHANNPGAGIGLYQWNWGGEICKAVASQQVVNETVVMGVIHPPNSTIRHVFCEAQDYDVTLLVNDTLGITWAVTKTVSVQYVWIDVTHSGIDIDNKFSIYPGTVIHISVSIINNSTLPSPATLTLSLDTGQLLANQSFNLNPRGSLEGTSAKVGPVAWDTTGFPVRAYKITVVVYSPLPQNFTRDKRGYAFVQLIYQQPPGSALSFSLLESSGLSILVIVALVAGLSRFRKRPSWETEPIVQE